MDALSQRWARRWEALGEHPRGRWLRLALEVIWIVLCVVAVAACWDTPAVAFAYLGL